MVLGTGQEGNMKVCVVLGTGQEGTLKVCVVLGPGGYFEGVCGVGARRVP